MGHFCLAALACAAPATVGAAENGLVAFNTTTFPRTIETFDPATSKVAAVPNLPSGESIQPAWSPDGQKLAFAYTPDAVKAMTNIYVIGLDGSGLQRVTSDPSQEDSNPTWSADGGQIAFSRRAGDAVYSLYVQTIRGEAPPERIVSVAGDALHPAWSPDGTQIALSYSRGFGFGELLLTTPAGVEQRLLAVTNPIDDGVWSPDGARLAVASVPGAFDITSIDRSGGDPQTLLHPAERVESLAWSPDGSQIAFSTFAGTDVSVIPSSGLSTSATTLVAGQNPTWAPRPLPAGSIAIGKQVDATKGVLVSFKPQGTPAGNPSTALVEGAFFSVVRRTPRTLSLRIRRPDCSTAHTAARPRKSRVRVTRGHFNIRNDHLIVASHETAYSVTETCRGSTVKVTEGLVILRRRSRPGRAIRVSAGHSLYVAGRLR